MKKKNYSSGIRFIYLRSVTPFNNHYGGHRSYLWCVAVWLAKITSVMIVYIGISLKLLNQLCMHSLLWHSLFLLCQWIEVCHMILLYYVLPNVCFFFWSSWFLVSFHCVKRYLFVSLACSWEVLWMFVSYHVQSVSFLAEVAVVYTVSRSCLRKSGEMMDTRQCMFVALRSNLKLKCFAPNSGMWHV